MIWVVQGPEKRGKGWQQQLINNSAHSTAQKHLYELLCKPISLLVYAGMCVQIFFAVYTFPFCAVSGTEECRPCFSAHVLLQGLCLGDESALQERWHSDHKRFQDVHLALLSYDV